VIQSSQRRTAEATSPEQLLGLGAERAGFISLVIEREEALDAEMAAAEDLFVEVGASAVEVIE
jgi:hypothetical protein